MNDLHEPPGHPQVVVRLPLTPPAVSRGRAARVLAGLLRFSRYWATISAAYAAFGSACSSYGRPDFPVNISIVGILGVLGTLILSHGRRWLAVIRTHTRRKNP